VALTTRSQRTHADKRTTLSHRPLSDYLDGRARSVIMSSMASAVGLARSNGSRTRLLLGEFAGGRWTRAVRLPDRRLTLMLARGYTGFVQEAAGFGSWLEPPQPAVTLMIDLDGALHADGAPLPGAWVAGLTDTYSVIEFGRRYACVDIKLAPLGAYTVLGRPLHELAGRVVALDDLFGVDGRRLAERLREAPDWDQRFDSLDRFLAARAQEGPSPTPAVAWALARLRASAGAKRIEALAAELGCSRRHLSVKFREQVGLSPKTVARLLRFEHVRRQLETDPKGWADIAYASGYCDQSHLNRDIRDLAGTTPSDFLARRIPGGGVIGDQIRKVQDRAATRA
jgi:AraC-like DNA-binding protein